MLHRFSAKQEEELHPNSAESIYYDCIVENCHTLAPSKRVHCEEACMRYSKKEHSKEKRSHLLESNQGLESNNLPYNIESVQNYEPGSSYMEHHMRPVYIQPRNQDDLDNWDIESMDSRFESLENEVESPQEFKHVMCSQFCENGQKITTFEKCYTTLCLTPKIRYAHQEYNGPIENEKRSQLQFDSRKRDIDIKSIEKRWPSRMSCLEMKCGRYANNQQNFFDCGMALCAS